MTFGLTPQGFNAARLADIKTFLDDAFIAQFGDINLDPQSVFGQEIGVLAKSFADLWENLEDVYFSQYPNSASGTSLDNVVALNGITRLAATQTMVVATCAGLEGTLIPVNSLASIPSTGDVFYASSGGIITRNNADNVNVQVGTVAAQPYTIVLDSTPYTFSLPVVTFSNSGAIFVTGNVITITINNTMLSVNFTTDSNTTLAAVATAIQGYNSGLSCTAVVTNPNIITITPLTGYNITINSIVVIGGASQASNAITFLSPSNVNAITAALVAIMNVGTPSWIAIDNMDGTLSINSTDPAVPFSCNVGTNLNVIYQASPISFLSENYGPIPCPANTLTNILTPIAGWATINNTEAGVTGTLAETDAALRIRRQNSIKLLGSATVDAIQAGLLQKVPGVTSAVVFENRSLQQQPIVLVFPSPFVSGDVITVIYNTSSNFTVNFTTNQVTTMAALVTAFQALSAVQSASYGGSGNQTLTINMNILQDLTVNSATANVSTQAAAINGGRPPKSFEAVVEGGSNENIANQIWLTKPAGIETYGNTSYTITDSEGNAQAVNFSRPTQIFIWVEVALTLNSQEAFPSNGIELVAQAILNYGNSLGVGIDVLFQRLLAQIFTVSGISSGSMQIAFTNSLVDIPSYSTSDITVADNQISVFQLNTIFVTVA